MKLNAIHWVLLLLCALSTVVLAEGPISSEMKVFVVNVADDGSEKLLSKGQAEPGQMLEYHLTYHNTSKETLKITSADALIPVNTEYVASSANTDVASEFMVSIDQGKTYEAEPVIRQRREGGQLVDYIVPTSKYSHVRWVNKENMLAKAKQVFKYRVKVQ